MHQPSATQSVEAADSNFSATDGRVVMRRNPIQKVMNMIYLFLRAIFLFFKTLFVVSCAPVLPPFSFSSAQTVSHKRALTRITISTPTHFNTQPQNSKVLELKRESDTMSMQPLNTLDAPKPRGGPGGNTFSNLNKKRQMRAADLPPMPGG